MRRIEIIGAIVLICVSSYGITIPSQSITCSIRDEINTLLEPILKINEFSTSLIHPNADTYLHDPGRPILPVILRTYTFPVGTRFVQIECIPNSISEKRLPNEIIFAEKPVIRQSQMMHLPDVQKDSSIYNSASFYPNTWFTYTIGVGLKDNEHVTYLTLQIYPVRYVPIKQVINYIQSATINIQYLAPQMSPSSINEYDLLIISPKFFAGKIDRLIHHKMDMGVKTKLVTTLEIYRSSYGRDQAEQIKYYIKDAFEQWGIKYVLLFGGMRGQSIISWYVPIRYSYLDDASRFENKQISDLYFADVYRYDNHTGFSFDDWDSNGNGIFGEWNSNNQDVLDMYPDVYVGRLPCRYLRDVDTIIDRIISYETETNGEEWFKKMAVIGGDSFADYNWPTPTDFLEGQEETAKALSYMDGFEHIRIWVEGGDINFTTENARSELTQGHGFVYFSGHGNPMSWATHPHRDERTWINFGLGSIKKLGNEDKLPVVIVGGCHNCQFDVSKLKMFDRRALIWGEATEICWGWLYASLPTGGSIATIGNTGLGYGTIGDGPDPPDEIPDSVPDGIPDCIQYLGGWIEPHFFEVYANQNKDILGETHGTTLTDYLNQFPINWNMKWEDHEQSATLVDCKTVQQWVLFGDPSLKIGGYQ